ncbi:hypothetical protein Pta02_43910 [Planobispora takensis]|uniref:Uncharacterized protein n=1 Tax=Planobispora takensis TaxID=1367882 RepID=A0A8J3SYA3_9ACTN|nr:hypothetical protein Pta02_43910 [Planobispora takensis]
MRELLPRLHQLSDPLAHLRGSLIGPLRTLPSTLDPFPRLLIAIRHMLDRPDALLAHHVLTQGKQVDPENFTAHSP